MLRTLYILPREKTHLLENKSFFLWVMGCAQYGNSQHIFLAGWCAKYMVLGTTVATKPPVIAVGFCGDPSVSCYVFHTSRQAMIKTCIKAATCLKYTLEKNRHDEILFSYIQKVLSMVLTTSREKLKTACELSGLGHELWITLLMPNLTSSTRLMARRNLKQTLALFQSYVPNKIDSVVENGPTTSDASAHE